MGLRDLSLNPSYETTEIKDQLLDEFYIPVLQEANKYYRIAGFFSSSALVVSAKGIEALIQNGGKMYLLVSPELSQDDYETIVKHEQIVADADIFSSLELDKNPHENLQALAWLLDCGRLEIKIVVGKKTKSSLFHQKIGILFDEAGDVISFSGSINETAQAWLNNIEEFKVFRSWEDGQIEYLRSDLDKFLSYWKNERPELASVYSVPESIKEKIIQMKPKNIWDLNIMRRYRKDKRNEENELSLFPHQIEAVQNWENNEFSLLMEMATGTGKTRTAIGCMMKMLKSKEELFVIVSTPQNTLSRQWKNDLEELKIVMDRAAIIDGSNTRWKRDLELMLLDLIDGKVKNAIIFTTHATSSSVDFINIVRQNKYGITTMFICDEVHAIGSHKQKNALLDIYKYRVGLSATPERMFDESGTSLIREYFGEKSYEFTIADALKTVNPMTNRPFLNRFNYHPIFVDLTEEETKKYDKVSRQIAMLKCKDNYDPDDLQKLYERRAEIGKNAENKYAAFNDLLDDMNPSSIQDTIIFVSDKQLSTCFDIMSQKKIKRAKITEGESASRIVNSEGDTERQEIISQFKRHQLQVLVGIKCLDEGIDIKNARIAVLMSNSTNPREYVQRVGRVIRDMPGKAESEIYDFIVLPNSRTGSGVGVLEKEAKRAALIARNAINFDDVRDKFKRKGVDIDADK